MWRSIVQVVDTILLYLAKDYKDNKKDYNYLES